MLIAAAGPEPADERFKLAWSRLRELHADIVDEHCYARPDWFLSNTHRYDAYDRGGPKVFMGEYAAQSVATVSPKNRNNLECALAEAAYMTGLERNADVVRMASYAPLFANTEAWQWRPDLIWVDSLRVCPTANYYVQQLYCKNRGDTVLPTRIEGLQDPPGQPQPLYASAVRDDETREVIIKVVNPGSEPWAAELHLAGAGSVSSQAKQILLTGAGAEAENSMDKPRQVAPVESAVNVAGPDFGHTFPPYSFTVLRLQTQ